MIYCNDVNPLFDNVVKCTNIHIINISLLMPQTFVSVAHLVQLRFV